jgi:hypothetical protein
MENKMSFNKNHYQQNFSGLTDGTSEEILYAIEIVVGESFSRNDKDEIIENDAYKLWEEGGREQEILAALPTDDAEDGEKIFWANEVLAEFDGKKWNIAK